MIVAGYVNVYFDGKYCWTGADIHKDTASAKKVGASLSHLGGSKVRCLGQKFIEFDTDAFVSDVEEVIIEDTIATGCTRRGGKRGPNKIRRARKSDNGEKA